jgi:hypothetical protein
MTSNPPKVPAKLLGTIPLSKAMTRRRVKAWLESKEDGAIVGRRNHLTACPLANYLPRTTGQKVQVMSGWGIIKNDEGDYTRRFPNWSATFVDFVDNVAGPTNPILPVTKEQCLEFFNGRY